MRTCLAWYVSEQCHQLWLILFKIQYAGSPFYTMGLLGFKLALLLAYLRISGFNPVHRVIIYVVLVATVLNQVVFTCLLMFSCHPVRSLNSAT